jgi:hypothetical protein
MTLRLLRRSMPCHRPKALLQSRPKPHSRRRWLPQLPEQRLPLDAAEDLTLPVATRLVGTPVAILAEETWVVSTSEAMPSP